MKLALLLAAVWISLTWCEDKTEEKPARVSIKIVSSPASRITPLQDLSGKELILRTKPANISGPQHLQQLAGECFILREGGYEYRVCPFYNVTQREERVSWSTFHGVLGVWREWLIEDDTFVGMHYVMGQECSVGDREVKVMFNCSTITRLHNTSEASTCHYIIWLDTPLACFKGAMQVYHLLTPEQLKEWKQYEYEYYADEITLQGLTKRRRKLLTQAGLLFDAEKERVRLAEEKRRREEEEEREREQREKEITVNTLFQSPLTACEQERDKLRKELDELTMKIRGIVKDFPAVAYRLGFLQNSTHTEYRVLKDHLTEPQENIQRYDSREEMKKMNNGDREFEPVAAVLDGGEWGWEREREGGVVGMDEREEVDEYQLEDILREINDQAEERDRMELKRDANPADQLVMTDAERGEREKELETDEQLLEQLDNAHPA